jgi:FlaA1/EpsC-like NDP-sugar epimerase
VVPTFLRQIAEGGPVTVTHPEMRRYFMTIPEAVQLVLQAGALGQGGEVFVLDMGEPVRIADLAADLIRLSGKEVGKDIEIRFAGTRPGEKLYEELFFDAEHATPTDHPKVLRAKNALLPIGVQTVVNDLIGAAREGWPDDDLRALLRRLVRDYEPSLAGMPLRPPAAKRRSGEPLDAGDGSQHRA